MAIIAIVSFLKSIFFENDPAVKEGINAMLAKGEDYRNKIALDGMDTSKFKDNIDIKLVMKMLTWIGEGYSIQLSGEGEIDYDALSKKMNECLDLLKNSFYKEEYI